MNLRRLAHRAQARRPATAAHFRRNHFPTPPVDPDTWALALGGAMSEPMVLPAVTLRTFEHRTLPVVLECAGHRRTELDRPGEGLPWGIGAVSEAVWTGVSLGDVLRRAGIAAGSGRGRAPRRRPRSRRAPGRPLVRPLAAAREGAPPRHPARVEMNGEPIPVAYRRARAGDRARLVRDGLGEVADVDPGRHATVRPARSRPSTTAGASPEPTARAPASTASRCTRSSRARRPTSACGQARGRPRRGVGRRGSASRASRSASTTARGRWRRSNVAASTRGRSGSHEVDARTRDPAASRSRATDRRGATQPERPAANAGGYCANAVHRVAVTVEEG